MNWLILLFTLDLLAAGRYCVAQTNSQHTEPAHREIRLNGLTSPAIVSGTVFLSIDGAPSNAKVIFEVDGKPIDKQDVAPYWLGGTSAEEPRGFNIESLGYGEHHIQARFTDTLDRTDRSDILTIRVIRSNNDAFSKDLTPYPSRPHNTTHAAPLFPCKNAEDSLNCISNQEHRREIEAMYHNWGIDLFLDADEDRSNILRNLAPRSWAPPNRSDGKARWSMMFSRDTVFYHAIPAQWPRVPLPAGYLHSIQLNTAHGGDGIGFGQVFAKTSSPELIVRSQWYNVSSTLETISFRIPADWSKHLPTTVAGDRHVIFIDPQSRSFVSTYKASINPSSGSPNALYAAGPTPFDSMGDRGGSIAANFAELPLLIQPGESTDPAKPISHAIGGPVRRIWAARAYPASAWDAGASTAKDSCSGQGAMNTGLVPYGGIIQLDPKLDLKTLDLSLPAFRILEAMQTYGYYVMDYGCADLDIYTALDADEFEPYGGLWGSQRGVGVQNEIQRILNISTLYVVAPLIKRQ
ncbi:MAG: hypothetical protein PW789_00155 [Edaphobacter sp.]|uniref:hypothetical protein n=1 Tax=Edaphobacter sp. TaxID=1934404 RepID=UPI00239C29C7|nr:hypothetical protein [Edaphobacter sp.]MDE1175003.1 hypothetical protein [Edaphobacter sp.]